MPPRRKRARSSLYDATTDLVNDGTKYFLRVQFSMGHESIIPVTFNTRDVVAAILQLVNSDDDSKLRTSLAADPYGFDHKHPETPRVVPDKKVIVFSVCAAEVV